MQVISPSRHPLSASLPHGRSSTFRLGRLLGRLRRPAPAKVPSVDNSWCIPEHDGTEGPVKVDSRTFADIANLVERATAKPRPASMFEGDEAWHIYLSSRLPVPSYVPLAPDSPSSLAPPGHVDHDEPWPTAETEKLEDVKHRVETEWRRQAVSLKSTLARDCLLGAEFLGVREPMEGYRPVLQRDHPKPRRGLLERSRPCRPRPSPYEDGTRPVLDPDDESISRINHRPSSDCLKTTRVSERPRPVRRRRRSDECHETVFENVVERSPHSSLHSDWSVVAVLDKDDHPPNHRPIPLTLLPPPSCRSTCDSIYAFDHANDRSLADWRLSHQLGLTPAHSRSASASGVCAYVQSGPNNDSAPVRRVSLT